MNEIIGFLDFMATFWGGIFLGFAIVGVFKAFAWAMSSLSETCQCAKQEYYKVYGCICNDNYIP